MKHNRDREAKRQSEAKLESYRLALERVRQGLQNILEVRRLQNGRYGNLTREEVEGVIQEITTVLETP